MTKTSAIGSLDPANRRGFLRGFTLVELLVVMTIMVLLAAMMPLALNRMLPAYRFRTTTEQLMSNLQRSHGRALGQGTQVSLICEESGYRIRSVQRAEAKDEVIAVPSKITFKCSSSGGQAFDRYIFYPDGSASGGQIDLGDGKRSARIEVSSLSGRAREIS